MITSTLTDEQKDAVNDLIEINIDSGNGFREAAENFDSPGYTKLFTEMATEREGFARELQEELARHGEKFETSGSVKAQLHRWWIDLRSKMASDDDYQVLDEATRGEDAIVEAYEERVSKLTGTEVSAKVAEQHRCIADGRRRITQLRDLEDAAD